MREFWLEPSPDISEETLRELLESATPDVVLLSQRTGFAKTRLASREPEADIFLTSNPSEVESSRKTGRTVALELTIRNRQDHQDALRLLSLQPDYLLITCPDWKVIPLENLIAEAKGQSKLIARTNSLEDSRTALATLEVGVDGISLSSRDLNEIMKTRELLTGNDTNVFLTEASIIDVRPIGAGSRVCVDTCEIIESNEGLLTGCSSQGLFLVEGEVHSNPHINSRPFRVNAGPVSLYVLAPGGKTRYLSELSAGEKVLLVNQRNRTREVDVARVKIERRPMILVEAESKGRRVKTILQNAETVRLITPQGSKPVSELKHGDTVLVRFEEGARHFGTKVSEEMIVER